ncbi:DUF2752 domain-containing protein [Pedobacter sp. L105]|uniref:DUF2752 domain-containing protein n=1 Tax=Pedobacter sp. L105 TaxID=1641871 RepID=UPI00131EB82E|nr:DUF2752 domain-containing protein [Pedobacter sp. L105]
MNLLFILSAFSFLPGKAEVYLLPCPFKYLTGYDCPGCGFQRALLALFKGNFQESFHFYPPAVPILLTIVISLAANYWWGARSKRLINVLFLITGAVVMVSYVYKFFFKN